MTPKRRSYIELHIAVFLFGFTAILGDLIQLSAIVIVWWRVLLTAFSLLIIVRLPTLIRQLGTARVAQYLGIGGIVAVHWICFYGSIKYANASIALVCMATTSFFTAIIEPLILNRRLRLLEIALGLCIIPGMILIVDQTAFEQLPGVWIGLAAAFLAALFAVLNKRLISYARPIDITFLEMCGAWIFISLILPVYFNASPEHRFLPSFTDAIYLIVLALVCTSLAYYLALKSLRYLSAFASNLVINLEPVYGIFLAVLILREHEDLSVKFYIGVFIILATVFSYPFLQRQMKGQP